MLVYALPLILTGWAAVAQMHDSRRIDNITLLGAVVSVSLLVGLRWYAEVDFRGYVEMFEQTPLLDAFTPEAIAPLYGEPGYLFLSSIFKTLGLGFPLLVLLCALLSIALKATVVRGMAHNAGLALCLYLCFHFVTIEFIQMRWAVATSLIALAFYYQYMGRIWIALVMMLLATGFHYFSALYFVVMILVAGRGHRRYYALLVLSALFPLVLDPSVFERFISEGSEIYVVKRIVRYLLDPQSQVGLFSYAKMLMYPVVIAFFHTLMPRDVWKKDRLLDFLFKLAFITLAISLASTVVPIFHYRAVVVADFFALMLLLHAARIALPHTARVAFCSGLGILAALWYSLDVMNYINADRLYEFRTWLYAVV